jgi:hypothetical protein
MLAQRVYVQERLKRGYSAVTGLRAHLGCRFSRHLGQILGGIAVARSERMEQFDVRWKSLPSVAVDAAKLLQTLRHEPESNSTVVVQFARIAVAGMFVGAARIAEFGQRVSPVTHGVR